MICKVVLDYLGESFVLTKEAASLIHPKKIKLLVIAIKYLMNLIKIRALLTFPSVILSD